jgi:hypothetical protein
MLADDRPSDPGIHAQDAALSKQVSFKGLGTAVAKAAGSSMHDVF